MRTTVFRRWFLGLIPLPARRTADPVPQLACCLGAAPAGRIDLTRTGTGEMIATSYCPRCGQARGCTVSADVAWQLVMAGAVPPAIPEPSVKPLHATRVDLDRALPNGGTLNVGGIPAPAGEELVGSLQPWLTDGSAGGERRD